MLSKVLSGRDTGRAQPAFFTPAAAQESHVSATAAQETDAPNDELRAAVERIGILQAGLASAHDEAFEAGRRHGEQAARGELAPVLERLASSIAELADMRPGMRRSAEKDVVQLSLLIARRILHRELTVDPNALTALARVVFERLARAESYRIAIHPRFADAVRSALPVSQLSRVQIEADPAAGLGTLVIRSEEGTIDASVDVQLEEISRGLTDRLGQ